MNNDVYYGLVKTLSGASAINNLPENVLHTINHIISQYTLKDNILTHRKTGKIVIAENNKDKILKLAHNHPLAGHLGQKNTYAKINNRYYWPGLTTDVINHVKACDVCQKRKKGKMIAEMTSTKIVPEPFHHVGIDVIGPLPVTLTGKRYIVVAVDYFTKYVEAETLETADAQTIATFVHKEIICRHGIPKILTSDRGTEFINELIANLATVYKIKHIRTTAYHPQGNGQTERTNRTLKDVISKILKKNLPWDHFLPSALFAIRTIQ